MAIFGNIGVAPIDVGTGDTTVLEVASTIYERVAFSAVSFHNTTGVTVTVDVYSSPDLTSASGDRVDQIVIPANGTAESVALIGQGYESGRNLIAVADLAGSNVSISYTGYTEDS